MAENDNVNVVFIPISRYVCTLVILSSLSMVDQCHGQWWFTTTPVAPPTTSPTSSTVINNASTTGSSPTTRTGTVPTAPAVATPPSSATPTATTTTTTTTTLIVMPSSPSSFGPHTFYTTVQSAIDAVLDNNTGIVTIEILAGTYTEKVSIPATKPFITLQGAGWASTIITFNDTANSTGSSLKSATFSILAANFTARNITFQNSAPKAIAGQSGAQAVAVLVWGDMAAFYGCGFVSSQDTICDQYGRHYFRDCFIEGNIDIIWGNGQSIYEYCEIQSTADNKSGCITAQGRAADDETTGFAFVGGSITGTGNSLLGRAYGSHSRVVFINTHMEGIINPLGWGDWPASVIANSKSSRRLLSTSMVRHYFYGEHGNTGPGANLTYRVSWMKNLTDAQAANFSSLSFIDGASWLTSET